MVALKVNGTPVELTGLDDRPLLWVLREDLDRLGPKHGCGVAQCGACRVLIDGVSPQSCVTFLGDLEEASVVAAKGLTGPADALSIVQRA